MVPILAIAFILVPLAELAVLIAVGDWIGLVPTLMLLLVVSVAGAWLAKREALARRLAPRLAERRLRRRGGRRVVIVDGTARPAGSTRVTWGQPEVGDRPPRETDPHV